MTNTLRLVLAQVNPTVGDLKHNLAKHLEAAHSALNDHHADLIVFPELSLTGYPPEDLLLRPAFLEETANTLAVFAKRAPASLYCLIGHPHWDNGKLYNACSLYLDGKCIARYYKQHLPNYGVFDEHRYFTPGHTPCVVTIKNIAVGLVICEDIWVEGPVTQAAQQGAKVILVSNASPYETDKHQNRLRALQSHATKHNLTLIYTNLVGGQDELIFDGSSMVINPMGELTHFAGRFDETLLSVEIDAQAAPVKSATIPVADGIESIYQALVLSLRDYVNKNCFASVILGLSGGIDSALTLSIAVDALGPERVQAVLMPSRYTENISIEDATTIAAHFNVTLTTLSIEPTYQTFIASLADTFVDKKPDVTEENIQARCRAILLMALSNKFGHLVLTTGNRSELAVGYCTLYGDMAGGFAVLKDVPKTLVYALSRYRNTLSPLIPTRIIERAPTAELAHNQKDEDSLPPYTVLDAILYGYLNQGKGIAELVAAGFAEAIVTKVIGMIYRNEYKRRQSALGPHINHRSFGKDWRYPVTDGFKG